MIVRYTQHSISLKLMALTKQQVEHVAKLSRLRLTEQEVEKFTQQLEGIFTHLDKLAEVSIEGIPETAQVNGLSNVMAKDEVKPSLGQEAVLKTSQRPNKRGMIMVKKSL